MQEIDTDNVLALCKLIESTAHRRGWDQPDQLWLIFDGRDPSTDKYRTFRYAEPLRLRNYTARMLMPEELLTPNGLHAAYRLALNLTQPSERGRQIVKAKTMDCYGSAGFVGIALKTESWGLLGKPDEETDRLGQPGVRYADTPGAIEMRNVCAVDVTGRAYWLWRHRGKPVEAYHRAGDDEMVIGGCGVESLEAIVTAINGGEPTRPETEPSGWDWSSQIFVDMGAES